MNKKLLSAFILTTMALNMTACANKTENKPTTEESSTTAESATTSESVNEQVDSESNSYNDFYQFLLTKSNGKNAVLSPESLNTAIYTYSHLTTAEDRDSLQKYVKNNYLSYNNTNEFKSVNRIWVNKMYNANLDGTGVEDFVYELDMSDSDKATKEKDQYVKEQTDGFLDKTSTILDKDVVFDVMNVTYFKDAWKGGSKTITKDTYEFKNNSGAVVKVNMLTGFDGTAYQLDNGVQFSTDYANGFSFNVILPEENKSLTEVDIDNAVEVMKNNKSTIDYHSFSMPKFEALSDVEVNFTDLGLNTPKIDKNIVDIETAPKIYQIAKINVDENGTEAAAVTEVIDKVNGILEEPKGIDIVCNRPFAYYIYDTVNDDIAFIGVVNDLDFS